MEVITETDKPAEGEKPRREYTYWKMSGDQDSGGHWEIQWVRDRWRDKQTESLQKVERRRAESLLLGRRQEMRQAGRGQTKAGSGQRGKDRREWYQDRMAGRGPQSLSLSPLGSDSFLSCRWIPFFDLSTTTGMGTGTLEGSGDSSKRSKVRATATFNSFMANCFPMQFLSWEIKRK